MVPSHYTEKSPTVTAAPSLFTPLSAFELITAPGAHPTTRRLAAGEPPMERRHLGQVVRVDVRPNVKINAIEFGALLGLVLEE